MAVRRRTTGGAKKKSSPKGKGRQKGPKGSSAKIAKSLDESRRSAAAKRARARAAALEIERATAARLRFLQEQKRSQAAKRGVESKKKRLAAEREFFNAFAEIEAVEARAQAAAAQRKLDKARKQKIKALKENLESLRATVDKARKSKKRFSVQEIDALQRRLFDAQTQLRYARNPPPAEVAVERIKIQQEVVLGKELLQERALSRFESLKNEGKLERISHKHAPGKAWRVEMKERAGYVHDRRVGTLLTESTLESIVQKMMQTAARTAVKEPAGKMYASVSLIEYGTNRPKSSPGHLQIEDEFGTFFQSFDATGYLGAAEDIAGLEEKFRQMLYDRMREAGGKNAIVVVGFQTKSFRERPLLEQIAYARQRRAVRRAARQRKKGE